MKVFMPLIIGSILLILGLGILTANFLLGILLALAGGVLVYLWIKKLPALKEAHPDAFKVDELIDHTKPREPDTTPTRNTLHKKKTSPFDGYHLAYSYDEVKFYPPEEIVSKISKYILQPGEEIDLKSEPNNKYDNRAIALYIGHHKIGYLLKGTLQDMTHDYLSKGWPIVATLSSLKRIGGEYEGYIDISFYRKNGEIPASAKRKGYQDVDIHSFKPINPNACPDTPLTGKDIVFAGYFSLPIEEMMQAAVDAGAVLKSRVTKNTKYLVVGEQNAEFLDENGMSSKQRTATKLIEQGEAEIMIINEKTFLKMAQYSDTLPF